ncbi:MAG: hypothetical protein NVS1B13_24570 [Flavisolibacter sp.]
MKKFIIILSLFIVSKSFAQVDSMKVTVVGPSIQARDWQYLYSELDGERFDPLRDSLEMRWHAATVPTALDSTPLVSVEIRELLWIHEIIRNDALAAQFYNRIDGAIRRLNIAFLNKQMDAVDTEINNRIVARRQNNSKRMQGIRQ